MQFILDSFTLDFIDPAQYPSIEPIEKVQAIDRAADGSLQIEDFRIAIKSRQLVFNDMKEEDYNALRDWFDNISNGAANTFTFVDEVGESNVVRITSNVYSFQQNFYKLYSGTLTLEIVN